MLTWKLQSQLVSLWVPALFLLSGCSEDGGSTVGDSASGDAEIADAGGSSDDADSGPAVRLPTPLGAACSADEECGVGAWCNTVEGFRVCSPRVFAGQPNQMDFVLVPAGSFMQGDEDGAIWEYPYEATITRDYFVGRTEITQSQWTEATRGFNPSCFQGSVSGGYCSTGMVRDDAPVEKVDWYSAVAYANWLSEAEGLQSCYELEGCENITSGWYDGDHRGCDDATFVGLSCTGYRLLTESEWEWAAAPDIRGKYFFGDTVWGADPGLYSWYARNSDRMTHPVALLQPNRYGLYDMGGNVYEWVWDWISGSWNVWRWTPGDGDNLYFYPDGSATDYLGPPVGNYRGCRGAGFDSDHLNLRYAYREGGPPHFEAGDTGFRLARTLP